MATYNTASDSANTAVRAFLTNVGEHYLGHSFNTSSGKGKKLWQEIKDIHFNSCCAYCGEKSQTLQMEHVLMFNRAEYGLHHPGNIVPCCQSCNSRTRSDDKSYHTWEMHLLHICAQRQEAHFFESRKQKILNNFKRFNYPVLNDNEKHAIRVIANSLYENIKMESDKSLRMYKQLDELFVK